MSQYLGPSLSDYAAIPPIQIQYKILQGIGKTRLALEVASNLMGLGEFEDGAFVAELAAITEPDLVLTAAAQTLGVKEDMNQPVEAQLLSYVRERRMLLVLDNFEQVLDAAPRVVKLLEGSPWLKVLVTSREPLHIRGERHFVVPPLAVPEASKAAPGRSSI
jgi:predicted ATPase